MENSVAQIARKALAANRSELADVLEHLAELICEDGTIEGVQTRGAQAHKAGILPVLLSVLRSGPSEAAPSVDYILLSIAFSENIIEELFDSSVIPLVLSNLVNGPEEGKSCSAGFIRQMMFAPNLLSSGWLRKMHNAGVTGPLLQILEEGSTCDDCVVRANAMGALRNLAHDKHNAVDLLKHLPKVTSVVTRYNEFAETDEVWALYLNFLHNLSAFLDSDGRKKMVDAGVLELVQPCFEDRDDPKFVVVTLLVANLIGHVENHPMLTIDSTTVEELIRLLYACLKDEFYQNAKWQLWSPLQGLANLSLVDSNKLLLLEAGVVEPVIQVLQDGEDKQAIEYACKVLSNLSFTTDLTLLAPSILQVLDSTVQNRDVATKEAIQYANLCMFQLRQRLKQLKENNNKASSKNSDTHVMLSYAPNQKELFLWLKNCLEREGLSVWMAAEQHEMHGAAWEGVLAAVEKANCILFGLSAEYKQSEACRTEIEYASNLRKPLMAIVVDEEYKADGWIGALSSNMLHFNFAQEDKRETRIHPLVAELERYGSTRVSLTTKEAPNIVPNAEIAAAILKEQQRAREAEKLLEELESQVQSLQESSTAAFESQSAAHTAKKPEQLVHRCHIS